jgi:hypothetical protein
MKLFMLCSRFGSEDGHRVTFFKRGQHYDRADTLARYFISEGYAVESKYSPPQLIPSPLEGEG